MRKFLTILSIVFVFTSLTLIADEYSRYNEIKQRIEELGFNWTPAMVKDIEGKRSVKDLGLLFGPKSNKKYLPETNQKRSLPSKFSWLSYNPAEGAFPNIPAGCYVTKLDYQGQCGSCWAFAAINAFEATYQIAKGNPDTGIDLSQQILVSCSNWNNGCNGGRLEPTSNFLKSEGTSDNNCYEYLAEDGNCNDACQDYHNGNAYKIKDWHSVGSFWSGVTVEKLKEALYNYGPVYTTMMVYDDFRYYYQSGVYEMTPGSKMLGGHAITIVGYDDDNQCFIVKNSWDRFVWTDDNPGPWGECYNGDYGYFRIHYNQLESSVEFGDTSVVFECE